MGLNLGMLMYGIVNSNIGSLFMEILLSILIHIGEHAPLVWGITRK
jgi:hypothetical protein